MAITLHLNHMLTFTQPGSYQMASINAEKARKLVKRFEYQSHVGFQNTRELMESTLGIRIGLPRHKHDRLTILKPGDFVMIFLPRQGYRPEPREILRLQDFEIMLISYELMSQEQLQQFMLELE